MSQLLKSHGDDAPSGENLEYDPVFIAMELAGQPEEERQAGAEIVEGKDPDYKDLAQKAREVLERSHDIRAAVYLADSQIRLNGLSGFAEAASYIRFCLESHWDTCHPQLDEDDDNDPMMRINAVTGLAGRTTILRGLRTAAPLTNSRALGRVTLRDVEIANGEATSPDGTTPKSRAEIDAAFADTPDDELVALHAAAAAAFEDVNAIDAVFMEKTPGFGPSLDDLQKMLSDIAGVLSRHVAVDEPEAAMDDATQGTTAPGDAQPARAASGVPGEIASRADVSAALDRIIEYYSKHEPSSPLPVLLKRARRLVGADFMTIINDLAPAGVDNVTLVGGVSEAASE